MPCSTELLIVVFCYNFSDRYGLSQKLHETRKLQKMNEKIRFLSQEFTSVIFIATKRMRTKYSYPIDFSA